MKNQRPVYGHTLREYSHEGITLTERSYQPRLSIPLHTHDEHAHFNLVVRGGYFETARNQTGICARSMMVFHPPGAAHSNEFFDQESILFNIRLDKSRLMAFQNSQALNQTHYLRPGLPTQLATSLYRELRSNDSVSTLILEELIAEMLASVANPPVEPVRPPSWLIRVKDTLDSDFQQQISLAELSRQAGVHKVHLGRIFHQHFNCTIGEYLRFLRVEHACSKLSITESRLGEISHDCGFADQSHFSRIFKRLTAMTPLQYRNIFGGH